ncbi:MAG: class III signal peptide-containing protein [Armatimonadota bacterium]|nr:class III signal peptide-containing protein [Armatimonadota bacterium]
MLTFARAWLQEKLHRNERGQGSIEYVLLILGVVLFLIVAAFGLAGGLDAAVALVTDWISGVSPPAIPGT